MNMENPCKKDCPSRCPGCHDKCERYQKFRKALDEEKEWLRKENFNLVGGSWTSSIRFKYDRKRAKSQKCPIGYYGN